MADSTAQPRSNVQPGVATRVGYYVRTYLFRLFMEILPRYDVVIRPVLPSFGPTFEKVYPCLSGYPNRIFIPSTQNTKNDVQDSTTRPKLPILVVYHAGGFATMSPWHCDEFCHHMANTYNLLVIAANYRKAPRFRFPVPVEDCATVTRAIIDDDSEDLKCGDRSNVAVCGFSCGANLAMAVGQLPALRNADGSHVIKGAIGFYGNYDVSTDALEKIAASGKAAGKFEDGLVGELGRINWIYAPEPSEARGPLASPFFAKREELPGKVYIISCEKDILWPEGNVMAERLAKEEGGERVLTEGGWKQEGIRWELLKGVGHSFEILSAKGEKEDLRKRIFEIMCDHAAAWLKEEVFTEHASL